MPPSKHHETLREASGGCSMMDAGSGDIPHEGQA